MPSKKQTQSTQASTPGLTPGPSAGNFPIVGIGASAGGLAAFEAFFSGMPADTEPGMAFVIVQHLAPDHKSILSDLLKRYTPMQVFEVEDGVAVKPNCAYIIPPNRDMALLNGSLQLLEPHAPRGQRLPIDFFFRSLAQDQRERAICIVLSGTGSDGTLGVRAVKGEGGMAMAQTPESTEYDGMPCSAIATGLVDFVLPPAEMPPQLIAYAGQVFEKATHPVPYPAIHIEDALRKIFVLLRIQTGHDFTQYKRNTIIRRIERRMAVHQIKRLDEYIRYCQQIQAEVHALFRDLLIGVTQFFRDPEVFSTFQEQAIPRLFDNKPDDALIRVWVPGCSTGEEAYSIAMLLQEYMEVLKQYPRVQVFATDIDSKAIEVARSGIYPASITADVTPERLARFFTKEANGGAYRIQKGLRDLLVFSEQNVIKDPPFSKLDLISCRNLLIYMGSELQKKLVPLFHYALNPGGFLFLGTSESVGESGHLFSTLDRKAKLYQRKEEANGAKPVMGKFAPPTTQAREAQQPVVKQTGETKIPLRELTERELLKHFAAAGALVGERGELLYLHGRLGRYLEPASGEANLNILKMAREGLRPTLTTALHKAITQQEQVVRPGLRVNTNGDFSTVNLTVKPLAASPRDISEQKLFLVILEENPASGHQQTEVRHEDGITADSFITLLQQQLRATEEYLQSSTEELETSNEELKSTNEELQSVNEELQSSNEELETSKEELQSVNEELATVNSELQTKVSDLARVNKDMNNLLASTDIGTLYVDQQLHIQRFTPAVTQVINLILSDVGRPLGHIASNLAGYSRLVEDVKDVLEHLAPKEIEVQTKVGTWFMMRIRPYRTLNNVIEGAVITFFDITSLKQAIKRVQDRQILFHLAGLVRDSRDAILVMDLAGRILAWNPAAERMYGWSEAEAMTKNNSELIPEGLREKALANMERLSKAEVLAPYAMQRIAKDGRIVPVWLTATPLLNESGEVYAISTTERERSMEKPTEVGVGTFQEQDRG